MASGFLGEGLRFKVVEGCLRSRNFMIPFLWFIFSTL